jgi:hypothetical protein
MTMKEEVRARQAQAATNLPQVLHMENTTDTAMSRRVQSLWSLKIYLFMEIVSNQPLLSVELLQQESKCGISFFLTKLPSTNFQAAMNCQDPASVEYGELF